jgi:photosystem II stability/assembly factor-like uncharacterized protein
MRKTQLLFLIFLFFTVANAQWVVQQVPTTNMLYDIYFADSSNGWITSDDGIFHTTDGGISWEIQYQGQAGYISGLSIDELWVTGHKDTLLHTIDEGVLWDKIPLNSFTDFDSTRGFSTVYFFNNNIGWSQMSGWISGGVTYRLLKTTNGGLSWEMRTDPLLSGQSYIQFLDSLYGYITGNGNQFFRTTNGGETWEFISWVGYMFTFSMQFLSKEIGWRSIDGPVLTTAVIKSTNGGEDWFWNITFQCSDLSTYLSFVDTLTGWVVQWTCISGGTEIWHTLDGGLSWDLQFIYSPPFYFGPREIFFVDSLHGWVIGNNGIVLHTSTGGIIPVELISFTAEVIEDGVKLKWVTATETNNSGFEIIRFAPNDNEWETIGFVPGFGTTTEPKSYSFVDENTTTGTYKYRLRQIDYGGTFNYSKEIEVKVDFMPKEFVLYQNYPNPFNPTTKIKYTIPMIETHSNAFLQVITLKIYDILGKEVAILVNEEKQPGVYEVEFDASSFASGIYLYQLKTSAFVQTNKMILAK